jgi:hypothetical protein
MKCFDSLDLLQRVRGDLQRLTVGITVPVHFVLRESLADLVRKMKFEDRQCFWRELTVDTEGAWGAQSYLNLREFGWNVTCSPDWKCDAINLVTSDRIDSLFRAPPCFVVALQSDLRWYPFAHWYIVQNPKQHDLRKNRIYLPHWPAPFLIPRDHCRDECRNIGLMGIPWIRAAPKSFWDNLARELGMEVVDLWYQKRWHDYSDIDVLVAIRSFDKQTHDRKPPWKLLVAWEARVPLIAGLDSAYMEIGKPGVDYLVAITPQEVRDKLTTLRDNPDVYESIVAQGSQRFSEYTIERTVQRWEEFFQTLIVPDFERWQVAGNQFSKQLRDSLITLRQVGRSCLRLGRSVIRRVITGR